MDAIEVIRGHSRGTLDSAAAAALLTRVRVDEMCAALASILGSNNEAAILDACLVIRDAATMAPGHPNRDAFLDALRQWRIVGQVEDLLIRDNHVVRGAAIYTLGKIGAVESVPALLRALSVYREADPLLVPEVIAESAWLGADKWGLIDEALDSPVYATRWSTIVDLAREAVDPSERARQLARLDRLARDENPLVSGEAGNA
jgi:hypothetical protein